MKKTLLSLIIFFYLSFAVFLVVARSFGILIYQAEPMNINIPFWVGEFFKSILWAFDCTIVLRMLTELPWKRIICIALVLTTLLTFEVLYKYSYLFDVTYFLIIPIVCASNKLIKIRQSIFLLIFISLYQGLMFLGRGYPYLARVHILWQVVLTLDFHVFLFIIYQAKEANIMGRPGCILFLGKFDKFAKKIGSFVLGLFK